MAAIEVVLPKVDMDMEAGTIAQWRVAEGDLVKTGDVLFEMETAKSLMEVESPATGRIRDLAPVDQTELAVGTVVAWIDETEAATTMPAAAATIAHARPPLADAAAATRVETPTGLPAPTEAAIAPVAAEAGANERGTAPLRATPFARTRARDEGIALATVPGSGPDGRIVAADVEAAAKARGPASASTGETSADGAVLPMTPTRRIVADRLAASARTAPHFYLTAHLDMGALRDGLAAHRHAGAAPLSATLAIVYLAARVLTRHPALNASWEDAGIRLHPQAHVGVAMDRDGDLVVPVLRDADRQPLAALAADYARLREAVRTRTIAPADMRGGTFTVSNLGMYGVDAFTAIINPPEAAILAIGRTIDTPVGRDGAIVLRPMATFCLSSDHRIVDGVAAARFMADLRVAIEAPSLLLPSFATTTA